VYLDQNILIIVQLSFFGLTFILHLMALCTDPGYIKKPASMDFFKMLQEFDPVLLCPDCEVIRTDRSRHCSICNKCVERFDHHCPWINNCVGIRNHGYFMCFLLSMLSLLILTFVSMVLNYNALSNPTTDRTSNNFLYDFILSKEVYV
jgi:hypothetical protein